MPREQRILAVKDKRTDASLDNIGVELDTAVVEGSASGRPSGSRRNGCARRLRFARDAAELLLEPGLERQHQRLAALLADGTALIGAAAPDRLLDGIESGDTLGCFTRDRAGRPAQRRRSATSDEPSRRQA